MKNLKSLLLLAVIPFVVSCSSGDKKAASAEEATKESAVDKVEKEFNYPIPTSFEVTNMLQDAQAGFVLAITNDAENADQYVTGYSKAVNLGVYGADLSYASTYNRQQETMDFLNASRKLIQSLNISSGFSMDMARRVENNLQNKDSLINIITEAFYDTYTFLNRSAQERTSLLVLAGSVIEGLYISSNLVISSGYDQKLLDVMGAQKEHVSKLVDLLSEFADDENVQKMLPQLQAINEAYSKVGDKLTAEQFDDLQVSIESIRTQIVTP